MARGANNKRARSTTPPPAAGSSTDTSISASPQELASIRTLVKSIFDSALHANAMGDRDLFFERASKDGKGGDWCIMEKIEGELEPVPAQFVLAMKLSAYFLTIANKSTIKTYNVNGGPCPLMSDECKEALVTLSEGFNKLDVERDIRFKLMFPLVAFKHDADQQDVNAAGSKELVFPEVYDARGQATINDAPKLAKYKELAGNPDVAIVFTPKVWSPGGGINAFVGGQRAKKDDDGNPVDKTQWSVSLSFVSITLLGHSGGGVPDMTQTPKKARRV